MRSDPALIGALLLIAAPLYWESCPPMTFFLGLVGLVTLLVGLCLHLRGALADESAEPQDQECPNPPIS